MQYHIFKYNENRLFVTLLCHLFVNKFLQIPQYETEFLMAFITTEWNNHTGIGLSDTFKEN